MIWNILNKLKTSLQDKQSSKLKTEDVIKILLDNRGVKTEKEIDEFLNPKNPREFTAKDLGIDEKEIKKAGARIKKAIEDKEGIIVYGDYDADGICATAILWESLYKLTKNVLPYIPERISEGYGLNEDSIKNLKFKIKNLGLIITVDHGITASEKIKHAKDLGIDVIVCDHHQLGKEKPKCTAVVHTDKISAAAISWFMSREVQRCRGAEVQEDYLDLAAIATIADLEPLVGINRSFVKYGLEALNKTKRPGLLSIFEEAGLKIGEIGTYEVGYIIAPRLNATGRMEHALESLRLLCTSSREKASKLAEKLGTINKERQALTEETTKHALESAKRKAQSAKLIIVEHESYNQGIIGLVAGKLVEEFYRPAIVVARGEIYSKASARSVNGFNIIEAIRAQSSLLVDAGGHPMAAGFTIETAKIEVFKQKLVEAAEKEITNETLLKSLKIDMEIPITSVSEKLWKGIFQLSPFGLGNPEPIFSSRVVVKDFRLVGIEGKHLKMTLGEVQGDKGTEVQRCRGAEVQRLFSAIAFNQGHLSEKLKYGLELEIAYCLSLNEWNGEKKLELRVKDIKWLN